MVPDDTAVHPQVVCGQLWRGTKEKGGVTATPLTVVTNELGSMIDASANWMVSTGLAVV